MILSQVSTDGPSVWPGACRLDGAPQPQIVLLFAHGAGAGMDHDFMQQITEQLAGEQILVVRFEFDYMARARAEGRRRPPERLPKLKECFDRWIEAAKIAHPNAWLGLIGKSMGGRIAALCGGQAECVFALGYPFHPQGKSEPDKWRWQPLQQTTVPITVLQGQRDPFGTQAELAQHTLPPRVSLHWLSDGDHSFVPRKRSGLSQTDLIEQAGRLIRQQLLEGSIA
ncbi:alpha/beta family hydrolase [Ferrimonas pelagia]|uniref:Alpha/beta fold hydrolase n=1 Tax=Ferrimonas pelagia TaxID=1177826 RepID=A0ABP9EEP6_9GAMM